jgi:tetratricopeptide (TPR) repeat protein/TolB-like protein
MSPAPKDTRTSLDSMRRLAPGSQLAGRYRIGKLLGVGGMGLVYEAHDDELDLRVAVKIIRPELAADAVLIDRFRRELVLGRQVSHPNVVRIHDIGQDGDLYFLTMDYVDGMSLDAWLQEHGRLDETTAVAFVRQIAEALVVAHRAGVIHRDLKPSNILVDSTGQLHISDFGMARSLSSSGGTKAGVVMGTPDYLSPEQAKGESVDGRSDLYSLGIILFEMLSGELPFPGGSVVETVAQRISGRPRELTDLGVVVSPGLRKVVRRCLEPKAARRPASAEALLAELDGSARSPAPIFGRRFLMAAGGVLILLATGAALWFELRGRGEAAPATVRTQSIAVLPLRDETGVATLAWMSSGIAEMLVDALAQSPTLRVVDAGRVARTLRDLNLGPGPWSEETLRRIGDLLDAELLVVGSARARGPLLRVDAQLVRVGKPGGRTSTPIAGEAATPGALVQTLGRDLRRSLDVPAPATAAPVSESPEALAAYDRGTELLARGDAVLAEPELEKAVAADPAFGAAWYKLAEARDAAGKTERALEAADRAVAALSGHESRLAYLAQARQASLRGDPEVAQQVLSRLVDRFPGDLDSAVALADAYGQSGQLSQAQRMLERVAAEAPNHPRALYLLGKYSILAGESRKAVDDYLVRAMVVQNNLRSRQGRADVLNAFGVAYRDLGDLERAQEQYRQAAELRLEIGDKRGYGATLRNLAQIQTARGNHDEAARTLASAMEIFTSLGDRAGLADAVNDLGMMDESRGSYGQALKRYREALQIRRELGDRRAEAESLNNVGYANQLLGDFDNASVYWHQALELYKATGNREGEILVTQSLGQLQLAQGRWDDAVKSYLKALEQSREAEMLPASAASLGYLGRLAQYQGRYAAALSSYDEGLKVLDGLKDVRGLVEFTLARAETWIELGLLDQARGDLSRAEGWLGAASNHEQQAEWLRLGAKIQARRGDLAGSRATLARARKEATASESAAELLRIDVEAGVQLLDERRFGDALRALQSAQQRAERLGDAMLRLRAAEALTRASLKAKDPARAERLLAQGLRLAGTCGSYAGAPRLYRLQAQVARARGDERAMQASLDHSAEELKRIQEGLAPEQASALERTIEEDRL